MSVLAAAFLVLQIAVPQAAVEDLPVKMGFTVRPDTVLIGQPFNLLVKVHAPKGVRFEFADGPDTTTENGIRPIELRGTRAVTMIGDTAVALYRLVAWDVGAQPLRIGDVRVSYERLERRAPLTTASVFVRSVLPEAENLRVPKPARPIIVLPIFNWWPWLALALAALISGLLWWAWRRYRNRPIPPVDPYVRAQREFARVEAMALIENGAPRQHLTDMVDVMREYLVARVPGVRRSHTTTELLGAIELGEGPEARLPDLLDRADFIKFAQGNTGGPEAAAAGNTAREIVDHVEARVNPESAPARRAAQTQERAA